MRRNVAVALLGLSVVACEREVGEPRDQWVVLLATDAPVPQLGDRVLVELLDANGAVACDNCRREFGITPPSDVSDGRRPTFPLSFGIVPDDGVDRVRVRLYRTESVGDGGLPVSEHIDAVARLPKPDGLTQLGLPLLMRCYGIEGDDAAQTTCDPATGALGPVPEMRPQADVTLPETGSWPPAATQPCTGPVDAEMVCIEGGVFLIGGADPLDGVSGTSSLPERLLRVAPFAIDRDEVTVAQFRSFGHPTPFDPLRRPMDENGDEDIEAPDGLCTYSDAVVSEREAMPLDCVSHALAEATCVAMGKRLPTEEEWEFAAGGRTVELAYPWGDDEVQLCDQAVVARGRLIIEQASIEETKPEEYECRRDLPAGVVAGGDSDDVTVEGVHNMGGNVAEWVADAYAPYTDPCWTVAAGEARVAPCPPSAPLISAPFVARGGSYIDAPFSARVTTRAEIQGGAPAPGRGFRCAKSM